MFISTQHIREIQSPDQISKYKFFLLASPVFLLSVQSTFYALLSHLKITFRLEIQTGIRLAINRSGYKRQSKSCRTLLFRRAIIYGPFENISWSPTTRSNLPNFWCLKIRRLMNSEFFRSVVRTDFQAPKVWKVRSGNEALEMCKLCKSPATRFFIEKRWYFCHNFLFAVTNSQASFCRLFFTPFTCWFSKQVYKR